MPAVSLFITKKNCRTILEKFLFKSKYLLFCPQRKKAQLCRDNQTRRASLFSISHSSQTPITMRLRRWNQQRNCHCFSCQLPSHMQIRVFQVRAAHSGTPHFLLTYAGQPKWTFQCAEKALLQRAISEGCDTVRLGMWPHLISPGRGQR